MYKKHLVEIQRNSCHPSWFVSTRIWYALRLQIPAASDVLPMTFPTWDDGTWLVVYFRQNQHQGQGRGCGWRASVSSINHCGTNSWTILQFFQGSRSLTWVTINVSALFSHHTLGVAQLDSTFSLQRLCVYYYFY